MNETVVDPPATDGTIERLDRERDFHDDRFGEHPRGTVDRFYAVADRANRSYEQRSLAVAGTGRVLELGCGLDSLATAMGEAGASVVGIDISPVAIAASTEAVAGRGVDVTYQEMNAEALAFPTGSFDAVVGSGILHHLDLAATVPEVARVLRSGGRAVFYEPMGHNPFINAFRRLTPSLRTDDEHPLLVDDVRRLGDHFGSVTAHYHVFTALLALPLTAAPRVGRPVVKLLDGLDRAIFRVVPRLRRFAWIVVLELADPKAPTGEHPGR